MNTRIVELAEQEETKQPAAAAASYGRDVMAMLTRPDFSGEVIKLYARIASRFAALALLNGGRS